MNFIKNIEETKFEFYDQIHESYFMYNTLDPSIKNSSTKNVYKTSISLIQKLRQTEYSFLSYYEDNGKSKTIEHMINTLNIDEQLDIINTCYSNFIAHNDFNILLSLFYNIFYDLHDRLVFYYRAMNEKLLFKNNNIYIINVNKHHYCVHYILKHFKTDTLPTMIFFDTHPDLSPSDNTHAFTSIDTEDYNDIGTVNIPILLNYKKNNGVHWILPDNQPYSYVKKFMGITEDNLNIVPIDEKTEYIKKFEYNGHTINEPHFNPKKYCRQRKLITSIQPILYTLTSIEYFRFFENITDNYILNIDLDYFISYGKVETSKIFDIFKPDDDIDKDIISTNLCNINLEMRYLESENNEKLNKELLSIRTKMDEFLTFINKIKNLGKIPKMIIFCDSSCVDFSLFDDCDGFGDKQSILINSFLPKRYAFWLRNTLFNHIRIILGEEIKIL